MQKLMPNPLGNSTTRPAGLAPQVVPKLNAMQNDQGYDSTPDQTAAIQMPASQVGWTHPATRAPGSPEKIYNPNGGYGPSGQGIIPGSGIYGQKRPNMSPDEYRVLTGGKPMFSPRDINPSLPANDPNAISGGNPNSATRATLINRRARQQGVRGSDIAQWRQLQSAAGQGAGAIAGSSAMTVQPMAASIANPNQVSMTQNASPNWLQRQLNAVNLRKMAQANSWR